MSDLVIESAHDTPLCSFRIALRGGTAADPIGREGLTRHAIELARRGAGRRGRLELDETLDRLGASLDAGCGRDAAYLGGVCLARNLEPTFELAAEVLAAPRMDPDEHRRLLREARHDLEELRDDDGDLCARFFRRYVSPGHRYSRTGIGTAESLDAITLEDASARHRESTAAKNLLVGFAGDLPAEQAEALGARLFDRLDGRPAPAPPDVGAIEWPRGRRVYVIDKPGRTQSQILLGHPAPPQSEDDFVRLLPVEAAFGGMFSSRLVQKIRVERGWSYGAGCRVIRGRGPVWFRMSLAPAAEVTPEALALTLELFEELCASGITAEELELARNYLTGSLAFSLATPRQRLRVRLDSRVSGLPEDHIHEVARRLMLVTLDETRQAIDRWLRPADLCIVLVATAEQIVPRLEARGLEHIEVIPYDSY